jgi:hypothetical protein
MSDAEVTKHRRTNKDLNKTPTEQERQRSRRGAGPFVHGRSETMVMTPAE